MMHEKCIVVAPKLTDAVVESLITRYAKEELCPCAYEEFKERLLKNADSTGSITIRGLSDALLRGVLNDMVLRALAVSVPDVVLEC